MIIQVACGNFSLRAGRHVMFTMRLLARHVFVLWNLGMLPDPPSRVVCIGGFCVLCQLTVFHGFVSYGPRVPPPPTLQSRCMWLWESVQILLPAEEKKNTTIIRKLTQGNPKRGHTWLKMKPKTRKCAEPTKFWNLMLQCCYLLLSVEADVTTLPSAVLCCALLCSAVFALIALVCSAVFCCALLCPAVLRCALIMVGLTRVTSSSILF